MLQATMLAVNRSAGIAPDVNLKSSMQARNRASDIHPGCGTQARCHQKSKTGVSVAPQKRTCVLQKLKKKTPITANKLSGRVISRMMASIFFERSGRCPSVREDAQEFGQSPRAKDFFIPTTCWRGCIEEKFDYAR